MPLRWARPNQVRVEHGRDGQTVPESQLRTVGAVRVLWQFPGRWHRRREREPGRPQRASQSAGSFRVEMLHDEYLSAFAVGSIAGRRRRRSHASGARSTDPAATGIPNEASMARSSSGGRPRVVR